MMKKAILSIILFIHSLLLWAQGATNQTTLTYDPDRAKVIPDKIIEIGIPILILFGVLNLIANALKNKAENNLKMKMLDKGVSEETLIKIFDVSAAVTKLQPMKWFLFSMATGLSLIIIHLFKDLLVNESGYFAIGIIMVCNATAFFIYYRLLSKKI